MDKSERVRTLPERQDILLFDGHCLLCNGIVHFVIARDPKARFRFASLDSAVGQELIRKALQTHDSSDPSGTNSPEAAGHTGVGAPPMRGLSYEYSDVDADAAGRPVDEDGLVSGQLRREPLPDSFTLLRNGRLYFKSRAALEVTRRLSGAWPLLYVGIIVPAPIRDAVYDWIARNRYRWFGRSEQCLLPAPEHRNRFAADETEG